LKIKNNAASTAIQRQFNAPSTRHPPVLRLKCRCANASPCGAVAAEPGKVNAMITLFLAVAVVTVAAKCGRPARQDPDARGTAVRPLPGGANAPRGVFDPIYAGLSVDAAHIQAALERRHALR